MFFFFVACKNEKHIKTQDQNIFSKLSNCSYLWKYAFRQLGLINNQAQNSKKKTLAKSFQIKLIPSWWRKTSKLVKKSCLYGLLLIHTFFILEFRVLLKVLRFYFITSLKINYMQQTVSSVKGWYLPSDVESHFFFHFELL